MNINLDIKGIVIITFLVLGILITSNLILKKEGFESESQFEVLTGVDSMKQRDDRAKENLLVQTIEDSAKRSFEKQGQLRFENTETNSPLMDNYINKLMRNDQGNPNMILEDDTQMEMPTVIEDNLNLYNHELRKLNLTKQIRQDYIIKVLRHKIDLVLNSLKSVEDIKADQELLKLPENAHIVKIIKKQTDAREA
jgi:hypothetical protein